MTEQIPTLITERLKLRPFEAADAEEVNRHAGERIIAANLLSIPYPYSLEMAVEWIETHESAFAKGESVNFAITPLDTGVLVGAIGLSLQLEHDRAEIGYWIGHPHWNQGYASEAARMVIDFGFERWDLERILAQHFAYNPASGKVMTKSGMQYEGCLRHHIKKWGEYQDLLVYSILRQEWEQIAES